MSADLLNAIEIETSSLPSASVIWLHGLGADGHDFASVVPELQLPSSSAIRFIFPHAPAIPITCNNGYVMPGWYDITHFEQIDREPDLYGIARSVEAIRHLITRENERGIPCERIVLAGFSQGGGIAYTAGLTHPEKLAGIIALSTYLPAPELITEVSAQANQKTSVFVGHGDLDPVVPVLLGRVAHDKLKAQGHPISWQSWPMQHSVCLPELLAIGTFLTQVLDGPV